MIIPQNLSQFKNQHLLLLVAGKQDMHIYEVQDNIVDQKKEFKIPNPTYSDNEGHFKIRSRNPGVIRSGSVREISDEEVVMKMIGELKKQIKDFDAEDYDHVYVFAPGQTKNKVKEALPAEFKKKIEGVIEGNYCSESPLLVLERISKNDNNGNKKVLPLKPEARKILKKSNQARKVIKGRADIAV